MTNINNSDEIDYDYIKFFFEKERDNIDNYQITGRSIIQTLEYSPAITFQDVIEKAVKCGYSGGVMTMIAENPLCGKVFKYNNYNDDTWYEVGTTNGYA